MWGQTEGEMNTACHLAFILQTSCMINILSLHGLWTTAPLLSTVYDKTLHVWHIKDNRKTRIRMPQAKQPIKTKRLMLFVYNACID
jgi:hypothetical protein